MRTTLYIGLVVLLSGLSQGDLLNGGFETPDPNTTPWFIPPKHWQRDKSSSLGDCYAGLHSSFIPSPENGQSVNWTIPAPFEGNSFVVLSTGDLGRGSDPLIQRSFILQHFQLSPGDRISGAYFFGTCDYLQYNDFGQILLQPQDPNDGFPEITLGFSNVQQVDNYGSTGDWIPFDYICDNSSPGEYTLICIVEDVGDLVYKSYLAVDGLKICRTFYDHGDINQDCIINLDDFTMMSKAWLSVCPDPNAILHGSNLPWWYDPAIYADPNSLICDPNCPCEAADITGDWIVDANDLAILSTYIFENGF